MRALSLRLRLTLVFAVVMAIAISTIGVVIYVWFRSDLNATIDRGLSSRSDEVTALITRTNASGLSALARVSNEEDDFAQLLRANATVLAATPQVPSRPVLVGDALRRALADAQVVERGPIEQLDGPVRIRAVPVDSPYGHVLVAVGTTLGDRDHALSTLALLLALGGVAALSLASLAGYGVATASLRPVEAMRRRASSILPGEADQRLPVARSGDEIERLGNTLNAMLDRLRAAFERERVFVADASHELRTPLAILKAEVELALREGRSHEELHEALESVAEETDRLVRLAEELLVISRLEDDRLPARNEELDVRELLESAAARTRARAEERGLEIEVTVEHGLRASADRMRIQQALDNLLDNALRYARSKISLTARASGSVVELHVRDDGPGLDPTLLEHAFERFVSAGNGSSRAGAGLGLAIVAAIAQSHGGHARAANIAQGGADVWLELAATAVPGEAPPLSTARR